MKNGYSPKEFAHALIIDYIEGIYRDGAHWMDDKDLTNANIEMVRRHLNNVFEKLVDEARLETLSMRKN
jgi:hypothetical protein